MIAVEPERVTEVRIGSSITLSVEAVGLRLVFAWQRTDGRPLTGNPRVEGASTSLLRIRDMQAEDSGGYVCEVTNIAGIVRSREAVVTVSKS